ncbi:MAG: amidohydrolase [Chloroflexi bacterium]|nr:amidohydrolase [Chloroflexota bacterium]
MPDEVCDLLLHGGTIITQNEGREVIPCGAIAIRDGRIAALSTADEILSGYRAKRTIDARGRYIFPGLINTHTHLFQTFIKGLGEGLTLYEWIDSISAPSSAGMSEHQAYLSGLLGGIEAIHCGTTTVLDFMYSMPSSKLYWQIGRSFKQLGLRGIMGLGLMENGEEHGLSPCQFRPVVEALAEWDEITAWLGSDLLTFALAPEVPFGITRQGYERIRQYASDHHMLITIHINENYDDDRAVMADYNQRAIPFLEELGFWGPDVIGVHCVKMQPEDIEIFARRDVKISHNPVSNMYLGVGRSPILEFQKAGLTISLATDGAGSNDSQDMIEVMKCAGLLHKVGHENPGVIRAQTILDMATLGGARAIGRENDLGSLEIGKQADLFIFDPLRPKSAPVMDPISSLVFSSGADSVVTTIIAGNVVMEEREILTINEAAVLRECQESASELAKRVGYAPAGL